MRSISKIFNLNDPGWGRNNSGGSDSRNGGSEPPRRPDQGGPPDLDEVWRDFNNRLGALFGRKGRRGGGGGGNRPGLSGPTLPKGSPKMVGVIIAIIIALWLASGFIIVQEGTVAVVTRFGAYTKTLTPGLQWRLPYPIEDDQTVNISQLRTFEVGFRGSSRNKVLTESLMLTTDENIVDLQFVVQYRLAPNGAPDYLFKTSQPDESVRQAVETAMREVVGQQPMDSVLYSGRTEIAAKVQQTGIQISTVAIQNVQPPEQVQAAFDDAVKAGQDRERQINEGNAYASRVLPEAQGQVSRMMQDAEGYRAKVVGDAQGDTARFTSIEAEFSKAPQVTRERMYLSTMQDILKNTGKIMVDSQAGNNMLYLPLDKIAQQVARESADSSSTVSVAGSAAVATQSPSNQASSTSPRAGSTSSGVPSTLTNPYSR